MIGGACALRTLAANNGNCQAPFLCNPTNTPVVQKTPTLPDTHTHSYPDYLACAFGTEINDMFGDKGKAATTVLINIAPLAPANYLKGGPLSLISSLRGYGTSGAR